MRKGLFILALGLFGAAGTAAAQDLAVPAPETPPPADQPVVLPSKGITMAAVKKQFGEPRNTMGPVGGDTPKHPPIIRWDYDSFVVIFEKDRVIDAVVPGSPPRLRTTAGLSRATNAPAAPSLPPPDMPPPPTEATMLPEAPAEAVPAEPAESEPIIPEAPADAPAPPAEPTAEAAPMMPDAQAPAGTAPAAAAPEPLPAATPPVQQMQPAPQVTQTPPDEYGEGPPTPK